jgi:hypothetical protein
VSDTIPAYIETFGCYLETEDGCEHDGPCEWGYRCGTCGVGLDDGPCPEHAPTEVPGLMLTDCAAPAQHRRTWVHANDGGYGAPCMDCAYDAKDEAHRGCAHSHHHAWHRWKITHKLAGYGYSLGFVQGHGTSWGGGCNGCMTGFRWGRSGYVLGQENEWWGCLLRRHHIRRPDPDLYALCIRCAPLPDDWDVPA